MKHKDFLEEFKMTLRCQFDKQERQKMSYLSKVSEDTGLLKSAFRIQKVAFPDVGECRKDIGLCPGVHFTE